MNIREKLGILEEKVWRMEKVTWYIAGLISIKFGGEAMPGVIAMIFK